MLIIRPYKHSILNIFDGLILQILVLTTLIPLAEYAHQQLISIVIISLPLILFTAMELIVHKESINTIIRKIDNKKKARPGATDSDNNDIPMGNIKSS